MASGNSSTSINNNGGVRSPGRPRDQSLTTRRREEIIEAASRLFAKNGYRSTDLNLVAEQLGVAKGTIYNYFESKTDLFLACVELGKRGLYEAHQEAVSGESRSPVEQIRRAIQAHFQFFDQNPHHIELMMQARGEFKDTKWLAEDHECEAFQPLMDLLQQGVDVGAIRPLSIRGMHDALLNLVVGTIFARHFGHNSRSLSEQTTEILEIVFKGIVIEEPASHGS